jgi:hypothetical protein
MSSEVTKLPAFPAVALEAAPSPVGLKSGSRPETGPMQFGDDWPGVFFRGDNAFHFAITLKSLIESLPKEAFVAAEQQIQKRVAEGLIETLLSCQVKAPERRAPGQYGDDKGYD